MRRIVFGVLANGDRRMTHGRRVERWPVLALAAVLALNSCGGETGPGGTGNRPLPATAGPTPETVVVKEADLPEGLGRCPYSGPVQSYLQGIGELSQDAEKRARATWGELQAAGATDGYVAVYSRLAQACTYLVTGPPPGHDPAPVRRSVTSFVVQFEDKASAEAAYGKDIFDQSELRSSPGAVVGAQSGLGPNSVVAVDETSVPKTYHAVWQAGTFYMSIKTENLTGAEAQAAAAAQHGRTR